MIWFLLLSLVPLMFVTGYSVVKFQQAIDNELIQRLISNSREFSVTIEDFHKYVSGRRQKHRADLMLSHYLVTSSAEPARQYAHTSLRNSVIPMTLALFNREGEILASFTKDDGAPRENVDLENAGIVLSEDYRNMLEKGGQMQKVLPAKGGLDLAIYTRIETKNGRLAGYVEEVINVGPAFLKNLQKRYNTEVMLFDGKGNISAASHEDLALYRKDSFAKTILSDPQVFFDLTIRGEEYSFITTKLKWGDADFLVGLGARKGEARAVVRTVKYAFFTMVGAICVILVLTSIVGTRVIVRPVYDLVNAIREMDAGEKPSEVPVTTDTELGMLTEVFNEMIQKLHSSKVELEGKVTEVQAAYGELKDTQSRLVHSAKMASLGQLVAGVAHELNNPIGFIYSNMSHLKDYTERMTRIIEAAEKNPSQVPKLKAENDYDYIVKDLPRLIASCEEGARRTRDIVLGLRSFSRLEEAKIKRVSLEEGLENTLRLLAVEVKNRVRIHKDFKKVPDVLCYASQLNQVFMNILTNATQAIDEEGDIWISLDRAGDQAKVTIRDSGKGIPSDAVEKIFDPFYTTKSVGEGTGLGLSISYGIVKKHGGEIAVKSELGKGTEFTITVPIDGPPGAVAEA